MAMNAVTSNDESSSSSSSSMTSCQSAALQQGLHLQKA